MILSPYKSYNEVRCIVHSVRKRERESKQTGGPCACSSLQIVVIARRRVALDCIRPARLVHTGKLELNNQRRTITNRRNPHDCNDHVPIDLDTLCGVTDVHDVERRG